MAGAKDDAAGQPAGQPVAVGAALQTCELADHRVKDGCTAVVVLVRAGTEVVVANAGDSRAVLSATGRKVIQTPLSIFHQWFFIQNILSGV